MNRGLDPESCLWPGAGASGEAGGDPRGCCDAGLRRSSRRSRAGAPGAARRVRPSCQVASGAVLASAGVGFALSISRGPFPAVPGAAPTVPVGVNPDPMAADPVTHTIYVGNGDDTVSVINDAVCNANNLSGCRGAVAATFNPDALGLTLADDQANHTLYVGQTNTVALISTKTCNASNPSGCGGPAASAAVDNLSGLAAVDPATSTIYVPNINDGTVSVIDGTTCNADHTPKGPGS